MKLYLQKRLIIDKSGRKSPRLFVNISLQCVLSGNQVVRFGNNVPFSLKGNRKFGNEFVEDWEILLDLRFKVYCTNRH